jgi:hypothetical protein
MNRKDKEIKAINRKIRSLSDVRKNYIIRCKIIRGEIEPSCFYSCKFFIRYKNWGSKRKHQEQIMLEKTILSLTLTINCFGNEILKLRGGKWHV